jgi:hypothetical protein
MNETYAWFFIESSSETLIMHCLRIQFTLTNQVLLQINSICDLNCCVISRNICYSKLHHHKSFRTLTQRKH